jgi:hypothetical protein
VVRRLVFAAPGKLTTPTGGYVYDRHIIVVASHLGALGGIVFSGDFQRETAPPGWAPAAPIPIDNMLRVRDCQEDQTGRNMSLKSPSTYGEWSIMVTVARRDGCESMLCGGFDRSFAKIPPRLVGEGGCK